MIRLVIIFLTIINSYIFGQQCFSNAGQDKTVCGGKKVGSNYRVYLDGTGSSITNGSLNYEWSSLDNGISFSSSQSRRAEPYFNYPQSLTEDKEFRIQLRVYDDDEICEDFDTVLVVCQANMCPIPDLGDDLIVSSGCELNVLLDASGSSDPDDSDLNFNWLSLDGLNANIINSTSSICSFNFPLISSDQEYKFSVTIDDSENFITDTIAVMYLKNAAPIADAGSDFITCESKFTITAKNSYDEDWNGLAYSWSVINGNL